MNKYETIFLITKEITDEKRQEVIDKFTDYLKENGTITNTENIGLKKLAYEIKKKNEAYYYLIEFEADPEIIRELERRYRITDEILKFIVVRIDN